MSVEGVEYTMGMDDLPEGDKRGLTEEFHHPDDPYVRPGTVWIDGRQYYTDSEGNSTGEEVPVGAFSERD